MVPSAEATVTLAGELVPRFYEVRTRALLLLLSFSYLPLIQGLGCCESEKERRSMSSSSFFLFLPILLHIYFWQRKDKKNRMEKHSIDISSC